MRTSTLLLILIVVSWVADMAIGAKAALAITQILAALGVIASVLREWRGNK